MHPRVWATVASVALIILAVLRIAASYKDRPQGYDEAGHIAAGVEWVDKGTYTIDRMHPTLGRTAIGLPLFLAGERYPKFGDDDPSSSSYDLVGNRILYGDGHYQRNLTLARLGVLPFFVLTAVVVFLWSRREFGDFAAILAVALFTTLPNMLAFSGLAYTDMVAVSTQCLCFFVFSIWLETPTGGMTVFLGISTGLAFLSKFTSLMFVPAVFLALVVCKWITNRKNVGRPEQTIRPWILKSLAGGFIVLVVIWAGYGFAVGHVQEDMNVLPAQMPSFQHFPAPLRNTARKMVIDDFPVPAPALMRGIADAYALSQTSKDSYLLGKIKSGGWWYFFLVGIAVKSPIPFLILFMVGFVGAFRAANVRGWQALAPVACVIALLVATLGVKYDAGVRHVLPVFPLMAITAGGGCVYLWGLRWKQFRLGSALVVLLLLSQAISTIGARHDYIGYFNHFAGSDPTHVLLLGCDLDCGQDLYRLSVDLKQRGISDVKVAVWTTADLSQLDFPNFQTLPPFQPMNGWIAVSARSMRFGDELRRSLPHASFSWLARYQPVAKIGNTISLYHITDVTAQP